MIEDVSIILYMNGQTLSQPKIGDDYLIKRPEKLIGKYITFSHLKWPIAAISSKANI